MMVLDVVAAVFFIAGLVAFPFSFYYFHRAPIRSALSFGIPIGIFFLTILTSQLWGQLHVLAVLDVCTPENSTVSINGREVSNAAEVLSTLRELHDVPEHHSAPSTRFSIDIRGPKSVALVVARDSRDSHEYWVFYPGSMITRHNEIGRISTSAFDAY